MGVSGSPQENYIPYEPCVVTILGLKLQPALGCAEAAICALLHPSGFFFYICHHSNSPGGMQTHGRDCQNHRNTFDQRKLDGKHLT